MKECTYTSKVEKWLQSQGIYKANANKQDKPIKQTGWYYVNWGGGMGASGIPDLICNVNGYFVGIELKATTGKPSVLQELNVDCINRSNGVGMISYPKDFEHLKSTIRGLLECQENL